MFPKQRIAITGAGSGLGRAISLEFGSRGWKVAASDIDLEAAKETVDMITKLGGQAIAVKCDVTRIEDVESLARTVESEWEGMDVIVNNAGILAMGNMEDHSLKDCELLIDINVMGVIRMCKVFIPMMRKQGGGHIVNIGSAAGFAAPPGESIYNTSKAGVLALSETLRSELATKNIGVSVVMPHWFRTNILGTMRTADKRMREIAERETGKIKVSAEDVARDIYQAVHKNRFYVMSMTVTKAIWLLKCLSPEIYLRVLGRLYSKGHLYIKGLSSEEVAPDSHIT